MAQIRLIATDLDGTFLASDHKPSQKSIEAVRAARQQGIRVCACSGRNCTELKDLCEMGGLDELAVINNGIIIDTKTAEYKYLRQLDPDAVPDIIAILLQDAREHGNATFTLSGGIETHIWRGCCNERMLGRLALANKTGYSAEHFYVHDEYEKWVEAARFDIQVIRYSLDYKEHGPRIQKLLEPFESVDITTAWPGRMEIVPKGVGKAEALLRLCEFTASGSKTSWP
jgi:HAD superfamily hydrolase (TIGR01484 family)